MRWFIADTHFGHEKVIKYSKRPFKDAAHMDNTMIARWNKVVKEDDDVFVLGDFGLSKIDYLRDVCLALNGNKILIRGNHDGSVSKNRRIGFDAVVDEAVIHIGGYRVNMQHIPNSYYTDVSDLVLHGHIHEKGVPYFDRGQLCLSAELWNYTPVNEKTIETLIKKWVKQNGISDKGSSITRSSSSDAGGVEV